MEKTAPSSFEYLWRDLYSQTFDISAFSPASLVIVKSPPKLSSYVLVWVTQLCFKVFQKQQISRNNCKIFFCRKALYSPSKKQDWRTCERNVCWTSSSEWAQTICIVLYCCFFGYVCLLRQRLLTADEIAIVEQSHALPVTVSPTCADLVVYCFTIFFIFVLCYHLYIVNEDN